MKKVIVPFLFALLLGFSSANAGDTTAKQSNAGRANLTSVLGSYEKSDVLFLAGGTGWDIINAIAKCSRMCAAKYPGDAIMMSRCEKLCNAS